MDEKYVDARHKILQCMGEIQQALANVHARQELREQDVLCIHDVYRTLEAIRLSSPHTLCRLPRIPQPIYGGRHTRLSFALYCVKIAQLAEKTLLCFQASDHDEEARVNARSAFAQIADLTQSIAARAAGFTSDDGFFSTAKKIAAEVETWPAWKKAGFAPTQGFTEEALKAAADAPLEERLAVLRKIGVLDEHNKLTPEYAQGARPAEEARRQKGTKGTDPEKIAIGLGVSLKDSREEFLRVAATGRERDILPILFILRHLFDVKKRSPFIAETMIAALKAERFVENPSGPFPFPANVQGNLAALALAHDPLRTSEVIACLFADPGHRSVTTEMTYVFLNILRTFERA